MRKPLSALAALITLSATPQAFAQSSVTVFGLMDVSITQGWGSVANRTQVSAGNLTGSRLGFRGVEDLGGGLKANFWLEAGITPDTGAGVASNTNNQASGALPAGSFTFNRVSYVGLQGGWGELRLGRDYTPTFNGHVYYDPAVLSGVGTSQTGIGALTIFAAPNGARASNSVSYWSPDMNGFKGQVMYALGENPSNAGTTRSDGNYLGARLNYVGGPVDLSAAVASYKLAAVGDMKEAVLGATYAISSAKLWAIYLRNTTGSATNVTGSMLGASIASGVVQYKLSLSQSRATNNSGAAIGTTHKLALGAVYNLSKRTALYATVAALTNSNGATAVPYFGVATTAANHSSRAFDVGIRHWF